MAVYFVKSGGLTKIGWSEHLARRVGALRASHAGDVVVLGWLPGGRELEKHFHRAFAGKRVRGEWFQLGDDDLGHICHILNLELPKTEPRARKSHYEAEHQATKDARAAALRAVAAAKWPQEQHSKRIDRLANELRWPRSRMSGVYYADVRMRLTPAEHETLALFIAPELKD